MGSMSRYEGFSTVLRSDCVWVAICHACSHRTVLTSFGEPFPESVPHTCCDEPSGESLQDLRQAGGIIPVAHIMGVPFD